MTNPLRIKALHHVRVQVSDLSGNERFSRDFGLREVLRRDGRIYMGTCGPDQYSYVVESGPKTRLAAIAFVTETRAELERAVREFGATAVRPLDGPGGGEGVSLTDPDGTTIDIVHGIESRPPDPLRPLTQINYPGNRQRLNVAHSYPPGPGHPLRLGHVGLFVSDFRRSEAWYCQTLGLTASDRMYAGAPDNFVGGFYRLDHGPDWVDHHTIAFFAMGAPGLHHMSFEVQDTEQQMISHRLLQKKGYQSVWGVGRHPLGSHIFDLWKDPNGLRFETFSDTDWCNNDRAPRDHPVQETEMDLWSNDSFEKYFA